ncbi:MAG: flippase-like domain-containing protein [Chloroflexi bacterium]|nr:flippase-like domain-containing protein [Chloroflexota bacterium]
MNSTRLRRRLLISTVFGIVVFAALLAYGDVRKVGASVGEFRWELAPIILGIALGNYVLRFVKWHYYLRKVGVRGVAIGDSFLIYMSGLGMTITPGKVGEWLKCYLLRDMHGTPVTRSTPILLAERLTDALALMVLAMIGVIAFERQTWPIVAVVVLGSAVTVAISRHRGLTRRLVASAGRLPVIGRYTPQIDEMAESNYLLMDPVGVILMTLLSVVAWGTQVVAFYLVLIGLDVDAGADTFARASFILPISTLAAALLLLPGGLGAAETGITSLSVGLLDLGRSTASAATLIIRVSTLWFAVVLGLIAFAILLRRGSPATEESRAEARFVASRGPAR